MYDRTYESVEMNKKFSPKILITVVVSDRDDKDVVSVSNRWHRIGLSNLSMLNAII